MKKTTKLMCLLLVAAMSVTVLAGCGGKDSGSTDLTYWMGNSAASYGITDYNQIKGLQKLQEEVGITVDYIHPTSAAWEEQFNIMLASQDYTDLIQYNWGTKYPGGFEGAFADDIIINLTEYIDDLPNYSKLLSQYPDVDRAIRTTDGKLLYFTSIAEDTSVKSAMGPMIRKDWLDKLGLEIPTTIDEWYTVLKAFKTQDPNGNGQADEIPFAAYKSPGFNWFSAAFGTKKGDVFVKNGKVVYGTILPEYKEFLTEMNKWFNEGLIDTEFAALEKSVADANMTNDISGACLAYVGSGMGNYLAARKDDGTDYNLVAAPWPSNGAGAPNYIGVNQNRLGDGDVGTVITTACKDLDTALEFMDFLYTEKSTILQNWGIEGESYVIENGEYKLTDAILNDPEGKSPLQAMAIYADTAHSVPAKITDAKAYATVQYNLPQQAEASQTWAKGDASLMTMDWPMTAEEKTRVSEIKTAISTYEAEMHTKMIMGKEPLSSFDAFVAEMKARGVDELVAIYQKAYDRFISK